MTKNKRKGLNYQLQINLSDDVALSEEAGKIEATPAEIALAQEFVKAEKNLETLGFFTPSNRRTRKKVEEKIITFVANVEGRRVKVGVRILPSAKYGLPNTADLDKYRAFQKILSDELIRNSKVPKHITFTSAELIEAMGISRQNKDGKAYSGKLHKEIEEWLDRMKYTGIKSEGAVWLAGEKRRVYDRVEVFERAITLGRELDDGTIADCHHIWLSDWQLENINEYWLLSLDYDLYKQLRKPIAKSLLPILQIGFYASGGTYTKRYDELSQFLGITEHKPFSYIKRQLEPSFNELHGKGFLDNWNYGENKIHKTYNITWWAGERFYEMQELLREREMKLTVPATKKPKRIGRPKQKSGKSQQAKAKEEVLSEPEVLFEPATEPKKEPSTTSKTLTQEQEGLVEELVELNVTRVVAEDLVGYFGNEFIQKWTEAIHYADAEDKAAYIVKAIREHWLLPEKWLTAKEQEKDKAKYEKIKQLEEERKQEEERKRLEETERLDSIYDSLADEQKQEVLEEAKKRISFIAREWINEGKGDSVVVQAEIKNNREKIIKEWIESGKIDGIV